MRAALFVDINTIDLKYLDAICKDASDHYQIIMRYAYGYIGKSEKKRRQLEQTGLCVIETRNVYQDRTPAELFLDMTEAADNPNIDGIYLATGETYAAPAIVRMQKKGKQVTVAAPASAARCYIPVSTRVRFLEMLSGMSCEKEATPLEDVVRSMKELIVLAGNRGASLSVGALYDALCARYHEFDVRNYGFTAFETMLMTHVQGILLVKEGSRNLIRPVDHKDKIAAFIYGYLGKRNNRIEDMDELEAAIKKEFPDFATENYGYRMFMAFLLSLPKLEIYNNKGVKLKQTFKLK